MPQMSPLSWIILFFYFTLIFMAYNFINYYLFIYKSKLVKMKIKNNYFSWKW
uniref:ATP synthase complex subunit 8 n=1 Tax=Tychobythinus sp. 1 EF-2015 TaxID=1756873 RepID=A0A0S2M998_9COLE|nr:ATP synthase F0 subunit 8 [Tychobythinus sp. 1 EF-2015]